MKKANTDQSENRSEQMRVMRRLLRQLAPYRLPLAAGVLCAVCTTVCQLLIPILCGDAVDRMIGEGRVDFAALRLLLIEIAALAAGAGVTQWLLSLCSNRAACGVSRDLRDTAMQKIERMRFSRLDLMQAGDLMSRMTGDVDLVSDGLLMAFTQLFTGVVTIIGTLIFMLRVKAVIGLLVIALTPFSLIAAAVISSKSFRWFKEAGRIRGEQTAFTGECVEGMKVIQAFGQEARMTETFDRMNERLADAALRSVFISSITNPTTRFVNSVVYAAAALAGALFAVSGALSIGQLSIFLSYANQYTKPFNEISGVVTELQNALACAGRIFDLLDEEEEAADAADAEELRREETVGSVSFWDVSFGYTPEKTLISGLNLNVSPGMRVAIVGPTGSGKTTLINLLMRFYEIGSGEICVSGRNISGITRDSLRASFGMVLQETWLMSRSVADNIAYGKPGASRGEIIEAAKRARAHNFIRRLPEGYDTILSGEGGNLSEGQKQLLCIARVMLLLPPMLILDEATSSIDTRTELQVQKAFDLMMEGRTSFVVAHRLSTIREADVILVLKDGAIVEQGRHEELLGQGGFYAELHRAQFAGGSI